MCSAAQVRLLGIESNFNCSSQGRKGGRSDQHVFAERNRLASERTFLVIMVKYRSGSRLMLNREPVWSFEARRTKYGVGLKKRGLTEYFANRLLELEIIIESW